MAGVGVIQQQTQPCVTLLASSLTSDFNGTRLNTQLQCRGKVWQTKGGLQVRASTSKNILVMGGTRFIGVFLSRLLVKEGHQVTLFTRGKAPITQQLHDESDQDYAGFSSKTDAVDPKRRHKGKLDTEQLLQSRDVNWTFYKDFHYIFNQTKAFAVPRRNAMALILSSYILFRTGFNHIATAQPSVGFREYIDTFDGYSFKYPQNWIQVRGAGADIFFRDPFVLDENLSVEFSSPSSSKYKSIEDLGSAQDAGKKVLKQYLTEFMSTRLGVRRESNILSTSSRVADDGKLYYQVEVNIKSYANNNELAVMPQDRVVRLEWDRRYLSVLGVENNRLYELRLQTPENVFADEENDLRQVMDSFRVNKVAG